MDVGIDPTVLRLWRMLFVNLSLDVPAEPHMASQVCTRLGPPDASEETVFKVFVQEAETHLQRTEGKCHVFGTITHYQTPPKVEFGVTRIYIHLAPGQRMASVPGTVETVVVD